jgi:hypothetical protein
MPLSSFFLLATSSVFATEVPSPEEVLGFDPTATGAVVDSAQVTVYFEAVAARSDSVRLETLGLSTEGRPLFMAVISSPENLSRLDEIRRKREKVFALVTCGIHPAEVGSTLASLPLLFRLAASKVAGSSAILRNAVVFLVPCVNPDGTDRVAEWLRARKGGGDAGSSFPFLQHRYTGHDLNRDWMLGSQLEVRALIERAHNRYRPWITLDVHQMAGNGPRIFVPPYAEPTDPAIGADLLQKTEELGRKVLDSLAKSGLPGGAHRHTYDAWTPARAYPYYHGGLRFLVEVASARFSEPVFLKEETLSVFGKGNQASESYPVPWKGGRWGIEEITAYSLAAVETALGEIAGEPVRQYQANHLRSSPRRQGFILESTGRDPFPLGQVLSGLKLGGVQVFPAREPGSFLVFDPEWGRGWCESLLACCRYPGPAEVSRERSKPYDTASHDLAHIAGLKARRVVDPLPEGRETEALLPPGRWNPPTNHPGDPGARWLVSQRSLAIFSHVADLVDAGADVSRTGGPVEAGGLRFSTGDFVVAGISRRWVERLVSEGADAARWNDRGPPGGETPALVPVRYPSLAVLQGDKGSEDEGWLRWVLEEHRFRFRSAAVSRLVQDAGLFFDARIPGARGVLLVTDGTLVEERSAATVARLKALVKDGWRVIATGRAAGEIAQHGELRLQAAGPGRPSLPGTLLGTKFARDGVDPLLWGYREPPAVFYHGGPLWARGAASSESLEPLLVLDPESPDRCGLLPEDEDKLAGEAISLARVKEGDQGGEWILFGFSPAFRGWTLGTFRLLFNAILAP